MNYPKAPSGSYKQPLIKGLRNIGRETEATEIEKGNMKLGIVSTFTGGVTSYPELTQTFIKALQSLPIDNINGYYIEVLSNGSVVPTSTNGAYVYDLNDKVAVEYVQSRLESEQLAVGELYFKS
jgi:predicted alternative tryptophan synthase beta-subunit